MSRTLRLLICNGMTRLATMPRFRLLLAAALATAMALPAVTARAHPHEFIDAALELRFDADGALTDIGVEWRYDAFTTMLILGDMGLNPAAETLSPEEEALLDGFDLNWMEGYEGDLWPTQGEVPIALGPPQPVATVMEDGQIISRHIRPVLTPVDPAQGPLVIQVYDPEYYIAYTIAAQTAIDGREDCRARIFVPDLSAARAQLDAAIDELYAGGVVDIEEDFPAVGRHFAEEIRLDCSPQTD
ncbi:MAG: DUF1007 family protein [Pararhodobacter sp.]|nr:DUF1007 family protein [Pararhodobacter sp.]